MTILSQGSRPDACLPPFPRPPDTDGLRKLAESTGGSLLNDGVPGTWSASGSAGPATLVSKHSHPLWNNWAVLLTGLGLYVTELVRRRRAKLL